VIATLNIGDERGAASRGNACASNFQEFRADASPIGDKADMNKAAEEYWKVATAAILCLGAAVFAPFSTTTRAQGNSHSFVVDTSWPKPLPDNWVTGGIGGVCVDAHDHVFVLNRRDLTGNELDAGNQAPPVLEFDPEGNVVHSFGDPDTVPNVLHGCTVDYQNNVWIGGARDGIVQKYAHDGKLLLQIGKRGVVDSSDGTQQGKPLNSSHSAFFESAGIAVDPGNGDVYVADGEGHGGNHRVAVFDQNGTFLRQWDLHREENEVGEGFDRVVHCIAMSDDGQIYVCDRHAQRIQVFDKSGRFKRNIPVPFEPRTPHPSGMQEKPGSLGTAVWVAFSRDDAQRLMYVSNQDDEQIEIVDRASGRILSRFGRVGHQPGEFTYAHFLALDSKGNIYVAEIGGRRVQKFKPVP
jgi:DNA-binding beta-propeller fold protein YncE